MGSAVAPTLGRFAYLRYAGQGHEIRVDLPEFPVGSDYAPQVVARFEDAYQKKYGYRQAGAQVEAVDWYVVATVANATKGAHRARSWKEQASTKFRRGTRKAYLPEARGYVDCAVIDRSALPVGEIITGPAIIEEAEATTMLPPGCHAAVSARGHLVITIGTS
jgi:N-methylhydantoinase A/oxoprolinase/acetone carboxylase beta subunit